MEADWDLHAVVRGCSSSSCRTPSGSQIQVDEESLLLDCQQPFEATTRRNAFEELHELYKPFFRTPQPVCRQNEPLSCPPSSSSLASSLFERTKSDPTSFSLVQRPSPGFRPGSQTSKSKKRKNILKKVCEVPAESVSSDVWAWRKYGQKPIKGSPFPRSYYRCSSSKGCLARKQVERNRSDPGMFIVTYTAEHNHPAPTHRNSLAGITRQKQSSPTSTPQSEITSSDSNAPNASREEEEAVLRDSDSSDEQEGGVEMEDECEGFPGDDFFVGLEGFMGGSGEKAEDERWDPCQTCFSFPWTANNTAAAAGGS